MSNAQKIEIPEDIVEAAFNVLRKVLAGEYGIEFERVRVAREIVGAVIDQKCGSE